MFTQRAAREKILKNCEAESRIDWNSKKKVPTFADVPFLPMNIGEEQKMVYASADVLFLPRKISYEQKKGLHGRTCPFFLLTFISEV